MPLFHPKVLGKSLKNAVGPSVEHEAILTSWSKNLANGIYDRETQNDGEFIQRILIDVLGYVGSSAGQTWTLAKNQPVGNGNVDVALGEFHSNGDHHILAPFELKGAITKDLDAVMSGRNKSPVQQAWEYAMDAKGAKWVVVSNYREIRLYAVGYGRKDYESFDLSSAHKADNYRRLILLLSADNLLSGATLKLLKDSDETEKEITKKLYTEYRETRLHLIKEVIASGGNFSSLRAVELAQTILDRVLFVAFAEDKGLLKKESLKEAFTTKNPYSPQPAWENFRGLFNAIDKGNERLNIPGYNGGLFATNADIDALNISEEMCQRFADLGAYDFDSEVSVNILGHVFEQSISDIEDIKESLDPSAAPSKEVGSKRHTDGIFYTPPFITRNIVEQTLGQWLMDRKLELGFEEIDALTEADYESIKITDRGKNRGRVVFNANVQRHVALWESYRDRLSAIKVVDPACGSGAFLNEVFDYLYREGQSVNRMLETFHGGQINLFRWDTHILANNIFGVDINKESVEITKLSLWLKTANRNEKLSYLDDNIKTGNSLIGDATVVGDLAFDWREEFPDIIDRGGFDIVLGNPPYVDSEAMAKAWPKEREYITRTFQQARGNWDLYIAFLELGCDLLSPTGYLSFITPDKWISKDFGIEIRKRILPNIISILPVGRGVFESALVDSIVTTIGGQPTAKLKILAIQDGEVSTETEIDKGHLDGVGGFDQLLSQHYGLLRKIEAVSARRLRDIAGAQNACATSDTYVLGEILRDAGSMHGYDFDKHYKVANTGSLNRYSFRWGSRPMRYLKNDYTCPIVLRAEFESNLGVTYRRRAASPKVMIKGLTLLDAALDLDGAFVPGKSTLVVCHADPDTLKFVAGIINSQLASFFIKQKYASASYNGGVNFTPDMLDSIPISDSIDVSGIVSCVDSLLSAQEKILQASFVVHSAIRASGGPPKLRKQFDRWYLLSNAEFVSELERQGLSLSIRDRAEWIEIIEENRAKIAFSVTAVATADREIDDLLFDAYGLDAGERELVKELC